MLNSTHNLTGLQLGDIHRGGGGLGLRPEVQPQALLYTSFDRKSTPFESYFVNITNDTPFTYRKQSCLFHSSLVDFVSGNIRTLGVFNSIPEGSTNVALNQRSHKAITLSRLYLWKFILNLICLYTEWQLRLAHIFQWKWHVFHF